LQGRNLVVAMVESFAAIDFLWQVAKPAQPITLIARFRPDAALYAPAPKNRPEKKDDCARKANTRLP